ncbi:MAG: hypothetical protein AAF541_09240 [Pseudomonadota bacterium]
MFVLEGDFEWFDRADPEPLLAAYKRYYEFLSRSRDKFSESAWTLAQRHVANDPNDHEGFHDASLLELSWKELPGNNKSYLELHLLGAYLDYEIFVSHLDVVGTDIQFLGNDGLGEFYRGELILVQEGYYVHEFVWTSGARWSIQSKDVALLAKPK